MEIFGYTITKTPREKPALSPAPQMTDDGAVLVYSTPYGVASAYSVDLDGAARTETQLITKYREMAEHPIMDSAIEDVVNEVVNVEIGEGPVKIDTDKLEGIPPKIRNIIDEEFKTVLSLLEFTTKGHDVFRRWYIDGRLYYHAILHDNPAEGLRELRYMDSRKLKKVREVQNINIPTTGGKQSKKNSATAPSTSDIPVQITQNEYYIYSERGFDSSPSNNDVWSSKVVLPGIKITTDSVVFSSSGLTNPKGDMVYSFLQKAIRPLNQLRAMEDSALIYRLARAPERRAFYYEVGDLPRQKAEEYIKQQAVAFKNKLSYDITTGEIRDDRKFMTMLEDYHLSRRNGTGTQIETIQSGVNLGEITDIQYFQSNLFRSLNVPISRLSPETAYTLGRSTEINRDEIKFSKFVNRLRNRFSKVFLDALRIQLIAKGVIDSYQWDEISNKINFKWAVDNYYAELKDIEIWRERLTILGEAANYADNLLSREWLQKKILRFTEDEIEEIDQQRALEQEEMMEAQEAAEGGGPPKAKKAAKKKEK